MACNGMQSSPSSPFFPPNFFLQIQTPHEQNHQLSITPCNNNDSNLHDLRGMGPMPHLGKRSMSFSAGIESTTTTTTTSACHEEMLLMNNNMSGGDQEELSDEDDDGSQRGGSEKKRRLNNEQVRTLEKNFEVGNKLEPERKMQLAKALGLQPRQVAIWFQNRRARWKTKQLEKDYDVLKRQLDALTSQNEALLAQNKKLQAEISALKGRETSELINLNKETEGSCSNRSENSSEINVDLSRTSASVIESPPLHLHQSLGGNNNFFASNVRPVDHHNIEQLLNSRPEIMLQCPKIENGANEGHFSNLLCSMEDQAAFWNWSDNHSFH